MYPFESQEGYHEQSIRFLDACFIVTVEKSTTFFMPHLHIFYALFTHFLQTTRKQKMTNRCDTNITKKNHITRFSLYLQYLSCLRNTATIVPFFLYLSLLLRSMSVFLKINNFLYFAIRIVCFYRYTLAMGNNEDVKERGSNC